METKKIKSIKDLPFDDRVERFDRFVKMYTLGFEGTELEMKIAKLGDLIVQLHDPDYPGIAERDELKKTVYNPLLTELDEIGKSNPKVLETVTNILTTESLYF